MRLLSIAIQDSYIPNEVAYMDDIESLNIMTYPPPKVWTKREAFFALVFPVKASSVSDG